MTILARLEPKTKEQDLVARKFNAHLPATGIAKLQFSHCRNSCRDWAQKAKGFPVNKFAYFFQLVSGAEDLSGYGPRIVGEDVELLGFINRQLGGLDKELIKVALEDPHAKRLMTIPGVGALSAVAVSCWIGEISRFSNAKKLASYFGLAPRVRQSADTERHGHITKEGNRMVRGW